MNVQVCLYILMMQTNSAETKLYASKSHVLLQLWGIEYSTCLLLSFFFRVCAQFSPMHTI